jgi:hypothetical protein
VPHNLTIEHCTGSRTRQGGWASFLKINRPKFFERANYNFGS